MIGRDPGWQKKSSLRIVRSPKRPPPQGDGSFLGLFQLVPTAPLLVIVCPGRVEWDDWSGACGLACSILTVVVREWQRVSDDTDPRIGGKRAETGGQAMNHEFRSSHHDVIIIPSRSEKCRTRNIAERIMRMGRPGSTLQTTRLKEWVGAPTLPIGLV